MCFSFLSFALPFWGTGRNIQHFGRMHGRGKLCFWQWKVSMLREKWLCHLIILPALASTPGDKSKKTSSQSARKSAWHRQRFFTPCSRRNARQKNFSPTFYSNKNFPNSTSSWRIDPRSTSEWYINPPLSPRRNFCRSRYFIRADLYPLRCTFSIISVKEQEKLNEPLSS